MSSRDTQQQAKTDIYLPPSFDRERIIGVEQVAELMNFSVAHIRRLYRTGKIPTPIKIGGIKLGWRTGVILDFINNAPYREVA